MFQVDVLGDDKLKEVIDNSARIPVPTISQISPKGLVTI
jgi:hypothetical protein